MKRIFALIAATIILSCAMVAGTAESADAIYDEIERLREQIDQLNRLLSEREADYVELLPDRQLFITGESSLLQSKKTMKLTATVQRMVSTAPENTKIEWSSSDNKIAKIDSIGKVTGVRAGFVTITAKAKDDSRVFATYNLEITQPVKAIEVSDTIVTLTISNIGGKKVCGTYAATATVTPADAYDKSVSWKSDDERVAIVDETGVITAVGIGSTKITVQANDGTKIKRAIRVKVVQGTEEIIISPAEASVCTGKSIRLDEEVKPKNAANKKVTWHSDDTSLATVDERGNVYGVAPGICTIYATATDGSGVTAACTVHVKQLVTAVTTAENSVYVMAGNTHALAINVEPANATDQTIAYQTSDPTIATVDSNGVITAIRRGTCQVTASACDGSGKKTVININVEPVIPLEMEDMRVGFSSIGESELYPTIHNYSFDTDIVGFTFMTKVLDAYGNVLTVQQGDDETDTWQCLEGMLLRPGTVWTADETTCWSMEGIDTAYTIDAWLVSMITAEGEEIAVPEDQWEIYTWKKY